MNEEEKKVVGLLQHCQNTYIEDTLVTRLQLTTEEAKILLNLVEKQQKEIEKRLKEIDSLYKMMSAKDDEIKYLEIKLEQMGLDYQIFKDDIEEHRIAYVDTPEFEENYISKDKIKELIENFVSFLDNFGDSVSEKLCEAFSGYIDEIDLQNVNYKIAKCFDEIIKKAAATQRKSSSNKDEPLNIPVEQTATGFSYTEDDNKLLNEFNSDYEEIMLTLIGGDYATYLVDMSIPNQIKKLYQEKWKEKSNDFVNPALKSDIFGVLGVLDELSTNFISCTSDTSLIKNQRIKVRNLYVKLHPEKYDKNIPYDVLLDDWNDTEF